MIEICNQLQKLVPPPFLTIKTKNSKYAVKKWSKLQDNSNYSRNATVLSSEIEFLEGFVQRKGLQLRLEKALQLTNLVVKLCQRWKGNDLLKEIQEFGSRFGKKLEKSLRRPSRQWGTWILYLLLRDSALLAKLKVACESAAEYWLGLVGAGHHWGDSLIITGILSRIWHLCSIMVVEMIDMFYPSILEILNMLESTDSPPWPNEDWKRPEHLYQWLRKTMDLPFDRARINLRLPSLEKSVSKSKNKMFEILSQTFETSKPGVLDENETPSLGNEIENLTVLDTKGTQEEVTFSQKVEEEDFGVVVTEEAPPMVPKSKNSELKKCIRKRRKDSTNPKTFQKYWELFRKSCEGDYNSTKKRKKLLELLVKYKAYEKRHGCQVIFKKLCKLCNYTRMCVDIKKKSTNIRIRKRLNAFTNYIAERAETWN